MSRAVLLVPDEIGTPGHAQTIWKVEDPGAQRRARRRGSGAGCRARRAGDGGAQPRLPLRHLRVTCKRGPGAGGPRRRGAAALERLVRDRAAARPARRSCRCCWDSTPSRSRATRRPPAWRSTRPRARRCPTSLSRADSADDPAARRQRPGAAGHVPRQSRQGARAAGGRSHRPACSLARRRPRPLGGSRGDARGDPRGSGDARVSRRAVRRQRVSQATDRGGRPRAHEAPGARMVRPREPPRQRRAGDRRRRRSRRRRPGRGAGAAALVGRLPRPRPHRPLPCRRTPEPPPAETRWRSCTRTIRGGSRARCASAASCRRCALRATGPSTRCWRE